MITRLFNHPYILYQVSDDDCALSEPAIGVSVDATPIIVLEQEGHHITVNLKSVPDLIKVLRKVQKEASSR